MRRIAIFIMCLGMLIAGDALGDDVVGTFPTTEYEIDKALDSTKPTICMQHLTDQRIVCLICHSRNGTLREPVVEE